MKNSKKIWNRLMAFVLVITLVCLNLTIVPQNVSAASTKTVKTITLKISNKNVTKKTQSMKVGDKKTIQVTVSPSSAKKSVTFSSSKTTVATVTNSGTITAKKAGTAKITVKVKGKDNKTKSTYLNVKVTDVAVTSITASISQSTLTVGQTAKITASVNPKNATVKILSYSSSSSSVASVSKAGTVTAKKPGTAKITVKSNNGKTKSFTVTVKAIAVTSITASISKSTLTVGQTAKITASVNPKNATVKTLSYSSSSSTVASVSQTGTVTAKKPGTAKITVKSNNGKTKIFTVIVKAQTVVATSVTAAMNNTELTVGDAEQIEATILPSNTTDKKLTYSSDDEEIATVSSTGIVKAKKAGTAIITVKTANGKTDEIIVRVKAATVHVESVSISVSSKEMMKGDSYQLEAAVTPDNATFPEVTWISNDEEIAVVDNEGNVEAISEGTTTITARADGKTDTCKITVIPKVIEVNSIEASISTDEIAVNGNAMITYTVFPEDATDKTVSFESADENIVAVSEAGTVIGINEGTTTIKVKTSNPEIFKEITVKIVKPNPESVKINEVSPMQLEPGDTMKLTATVLPEKADQTVTWESDTPKVASIDATTGVVIANAQGNAKITATTVNGKMAEFVINVKEVVQVPDGLKMKVFGALKDNNGDVYQTNTTIMGQDLIVEVTAYKDNALFKNCNITLNMEKISGTINPYVVYGDGNNTGQTKQFAKTNENGVATFTIATGPDETVNPFDFETASYKLVATVNLSDFQQQTDPTSVVFGSIALNNVDVLNGTEEYDSLVPSDTATFYNDGISTTTLENNGDDDFDYNVDYVNSQRYSDKNYDHKVYLSSIPYLVVPYSGTATGKTWTNTIDSDKNSTGSITVYDKSIAVASNVRIGTYRLDIAFDKINLSDYSKVYFDLIDEDGNKYALQKDGKTISGLTTSELKNAMTNNTITLALADSSGLAKNGSLTITVCSKGQINSTNEGCIVKSVSGTTTKDVSGYFDTLSLNNAFKWEKVDKNNLPNSPTKGTLTLTDARKYVSLTGDDSSYANYKFEYEIPTYPATGNALITITSGNGEAKYYTYPTYYSKSAKQNVLADVDNNYRECYGVDYSVSCTLDEYNTSTGDVEQDGNTAIVDSDKVGTTYLKASLTLNGLINLDISNKVIYTAIQWAPLNLVQKKEVVPDYFSVEGQKVEVKVKLTDASGTPKTGDVVFAYEAKDSVSDIRDTITVSNTNGTAILELTGTNAGYIKKLTAKAANSGYQCTMYIGDNEVGTSKYEDATETVVKANIYWVDLGLSFADKEDDTTWYTEFGTAAPKQIGSVTAPVSQVAVGNDLWKIQYLPVGRSEIFTYTEDAVENINEFISVSGISVTYATERTDDVCANTLKTENGIAVLSSTKIGTTTLIGTLDLTKDLSNVVFHYYDNEGNVQDKKNVGIDTLSAAKNTKMISYHSWVNDSVTKLSLTPQNANSVVEGTDTIVYLRALDGLGNPIVGKSIDENGLSGAEYANPDITTTNKYGILALKVDGKEKKAGDETSVRVTMNKETASLSLSYTTADKNFKIEKAEVKDNVTILLTFSSKINGTLLKKMFKLTKDDGTSCEPSLVSQNGNTITLTFDNSNAINSSRDYQISISESEDSLGMLHNIYSDNNGQIITVEEFEVTMPSE